MDNVTERLSKFFSYLILGIVQGFTEIVPVSSSAHLALATHVLQDILGFQDFTFRGAILLHFGTLIVVVITYRADLRELSQGFVHTVIRILRQPQQKPISLRDLDVPGSVSLRILLSLTITGGVALPLRPIASLLFEQPVLPSLLLFVNGIVLLVVARVVTGTKKIDELRMLNYFIIGVVQGLAILPGVSRLGMTLCAGILSGLSWFEALKLAFLLSIPTVIGAIVLETAVYCLYSRFPMGNEFIYAIFGIIISYIIGFILLRTLIGDVYSGRQKLMFFGCYCCMVGVFFSLYFIYLS
jgi:undecaprenyl-diphosphatase